MKISYETDDSKEWTDVRDIRNFDFDSIDRELIIYKTDDTKLVIKNIIQFFSF